MEKVCLLIICLCNPNLLKRTKVGGVLLPLVFISAGNCNVFAEINGHVFLMSIGGKIHNDR